MQIEEKKSFDPSTPKRNKDSEKRPRLSTIKKSTKAKDIVQSNSKKSETVEVHV